MLNLKSIAGVHREMNTAFVVLMGLLTSSPFSVKAQLEPFDTYGAISWADEKAHLDNFAIALKHDSDSIGYIIVYAGRRTCLGEAKDRAMRAKKYIIQTRGIPVSRIKLIDGGYREEVTVVLQPAPRAAPKLTASPTVKPSEVQIIKHCKLRRLNSKKCH